MGLLDMNFDDPQQAGLLGLATGLLNAGGPSLRPTSFGQAIGQGMQGYMGARQQAQKDQMLQEQLKMLKLQEQRAQGMYDMQRQAFADVGGSPQSQSSPAMPGQLGSGTFGEVSPPAGMPAIPRQQASAPNSEAELRKLQQYAILGVPGAKELFEIYKYKTDGIKRDPGSIIERVDGSREFVPDVKSGIGSYDFKTNTMTPVGGFADWQAKLEGAKTGAQEAAKAPYNVTTLNLKDGPRVVSNAQLPSMFGVGTTEGPQGLDTSRLTPQQVDFLKKQNPEAFQNGVARFTGKPDAGPGMALEDDASKEQKLGDIRLRQATQGKINDNWISTSYNPALQSGKDAMSMQANLDALSNIDIKTGWNTEAKAAAANMLTGLGIAPENAKMFAANAQKFQSIAGDRLWNTLNAAKGPQTEGDANRAKQVFAQLQNTPEANQFIMDFARAKASRDLRRAQYYEEALPLAQAEGDLSKVDREWRKIEGSIWADPTLQKYVRSK
jgi:hypothetical protein